MLRKIDCKNLWLCILVMLTLNIYVAKPQVPGEQRDICREPVPYGWISSKVGQVCEGGSSFTLDDYHRKITYYLGLPPGSKLFLSAGVKPQGWVKTSRSPGPAIPAIINGKLGTTIYDNNDIVKVEGLPTGSQVEMFDDVPPLGWVRTAIRLNPDAFDISQHYETITKIEGKPDGEIIEIINHFTPIGYVALEISARKIGGFTFATRKIIKLEGLKGIDEVDVVGAVAPDGWVAIEMGYKDIAPGQRFETMKIRRISSLDPTKTYKFFGGNPPEGWITTDYVAENTGTAIYVVKMIRNFISPLSGNEMTIMDAFTPKGWMAVSNGKRFFIDAIFETRDIIRTNSMDPSKKYTMAETVPPEGWLITSTSSETVGTTTYEQFGIENYYNKPVGTTLTIVDNGFSGVLPPEGWTVMSTGTVQGLISIYKTYTVKKQATVVRGRANGTWTKAGNPYILSGQVVIEDYAKLMIEPGVQVQTFSNQDNLVVYGKLLVRGLPGDSVSFTGMRSPGDVVTTPGGYLTLNPGSVTSLDHSIIEKWGDNYREQSAVLINTSDVTISNSAIRNNLYTAVRIAPGAKPMVHSNSFAANKHGVETMVSGLANFGANKNANIMLVTSTETNEQLLLKQPGEGAYYFFPVQFQINEGTTLRIEPGTELRWTGENQLYPDIFSVYGTLIARGTATDPIRFTGHENWKLSTRNAYAGNIVFTKESKNNILENVVFDKMGFGSINTGNGGALAVNTSSFKMSSSTIKNSAFSGITIGGNITPEIVKNTFLNNNAAIQTPLNSIKGIQDNTGAKIVLLSDGPGSNVSIPIPGIDSYYQIQSTLSVPKDITLEIAAGTRLDFGSFNGELIVDGKLLAKGTEKLPILFSRSSPPSSFSNLASVTLGTGSKGSVLTHLKMDGMGNLEARKGALEISTSDVTLSKLEIVNSLYAGIICYGGDPIITESKIVNNWIGVQSWTASPTLNNCEIASNSHFGVQVLSNYDVKVDARNSSWGDVSGPLHQTLNPQGKGNEVSDKVLFKPFKTSNKLSQQITIDAPDIKTYGDADFEIKASSTSGLPIKVTSENTTVAEILSNQLLHIKSAGKSILTFVQEGDERYEAEKVTYEITVNQAKLTLKAEDKNKLYGDDNPALTLLITGLVNGDRPESFSSDAVLATTAIQSSRPGVYPITVSGGSNPNYAVAFLSGQLTVNPAPAPQILSADVLTAVEGSEITITGKYFLDAEVVSFRFQLFR